MTKQNAKQVEVIQSTPSAVVVRHIKLDPNAGKKPAKKEKPKVKQNNRWPLSKVMSLLDVPEGGNRVSVATIQQGNKTVMLKSKVGVNSKGLLKVLTFDGTIVNLRHDAEVEVQSYNAALEKKLDAIAAEEPVITMTELRSLRGFTLTELIICIAALGILGVGAVLAFALIRYLLLAV